MEYIIYIVFALILTGTLYNVAYIFSYKKFPSSYFEFDKYKIDVRRVRNIYKVRTRIKNYPDSMITEDKFYHSDLCISISLILFLIISVIIIRFGYSKSGYLYAFKIFMLYMYVVIILHSILMFLIRYMDAKETSYYMGVVYRALLSREIFESKNIDTCAILPLGYVNLHFYDNHPKSKVTNIRLDRDKKVAELYSGDKRKYKVKYFDLNVIEHTDFLDQFVSDLTFVENKVDLKRLFNDVYFSDKELIIINDYEINT